MESANPKTDSARIPVWLPACGLVGIAAFSGLFAFLIPDRAPLLLQTGAGFFLLACWAFCLAIRGPGRLRWVEITLVWRSPIWNQIAAQTLVLAYWSLYCPEVGHRKLVLFTQLAFALAVDLLSNWQIRNRLSASISFVAVVLSIDFFIWFGEHAAWQGLLIIAIALLTKGLLRWRRPGYAHIFNPSGAALAAAGIFYFLFARGWAFIPLNEYLLLPPNISEVILATSFLVQIAYGTAPTTLAAAAAMLLVHFPLRDLGLNTLPYPFEAQNWIGLTLLMTDPATTPRSLLGRAYFGCIFGILFVVIQGVLNAIYGPGGVYFSKIFAVPIANLLTPWLDGLAAETLVWAGDRGFLSWPRLANAAAMAGIVSLFGLSFTRQEKRKIFEEPHKTEFKLQHAPAVLRIASDGTGVRCADNPVFCTPFSFVSEYRMWSGPSR